MDQATPSTASANTLHCALELSKKSWLLAIQFPDRELRRYSAFENSPMPEALASAPWLGPPSS
jgi:hypothetical protein